VRKLALLLLILPSLLSAEIFYRANGATSVVLRRICVPEFAGPEIFPVDFDTTNLTISVAATGDAADTVFPYTGANVDNYDGTPPAWGAPPASAIEVEARANGCVNLHIRDEVFAVSGAVEWSIAFSDSTTDQIMDWNVQVLALGTSADIQSAAQAAIVAEDVPDNTDLNARTLATADYATAATQTTHTTLIGGVDEAVWDADPINFTDVDTWGELFNNLDTDVDSVLADTAEIGTAGAGLTAVAWNATWDAEVESEVEDAVGADVTAILLDTGTTIPGTITTIDTEIGVIDTNVDSILVDTATTLDSKINAIDDYLDTEIAAILEDTGTTLQTNVALMSSGIISCQAQTGTLSTTVATTNLTGYGNDQLIGRVIIWLSGNADGEASPITDYASTNGTVTFQALTTAPGNGDLCKII
jgi:hypothetical protein